MDIIQKYSIFKKEDSARPGGSCSMREEIQKRNNKHGGNRRKGGTLEELKWSSSSVKGILNIELVNPPLWETIQSLCSSPYTISTCFSCTCCPSCTMHICTYTAYIFIKVGTVL